MDSYDGGNGGMSETDRHHYVTNEQGKGMICAQLIHHRQREQHQSNMLQRTQRAHLCTCIRSLCTEAPNVCDSTNSTNTAILNTSNHNRYRAPDLIRFDTDSAYVILQPGSDFRERRNSVGWRSTLKCVVIDTGREAEETLHIISQNKCICTTFNTDYWRASNENLYNIYCDWTFRSLRIWP